MGFPNKSRFSRWTLVESHGGGRVIELHSIIFFSIALYGVESNHVSSLCITIDVNHIVNHITLVGASDVRIFNVSAPWQCIEM